MDFGFGQTAGLLCAENAQQALMRQFCKERNICHRANRKNRSVMQKNHPRNRMWIKKQPEKEAATPENASSGWTASLRWAYRFCLIVLLIGALCFHSCQRRKSPEESGSTPVATATTSAEKVENSEKDTQTDAPDVATDTTKTTQAEERQSDRRQADHTGCQGSEQGRSDPY